MESEQGEHVIRPVGTPVGLTDWESVGGAGTDG